MSGPTRVEIDEQIDERIEHFRAAQHSLEREERKEALKEAFKEVMQEHLARVGAWTLAGIGSLVVGAALYLLYWAVAIKLGITPSLPLK